MAFGGLEKDANIIRRVWSNLHSFGVLLFICSFEGLGSRDTVEVQVRFGCATSLKSLQFYIERLFNPNYCVPLHTHK